MIVLFAARRIPFTALAEILTVARAHPGQEDVEVRVGDRALRLGAEYRVDGSPECVRELEEFGGVERCSPVSAAGDGSGPIAGAPVTAPREEAPHGDGRAGTA